MDYSEKWGKDVDEAIELALSELKLSRDEVDIIVLEESSKGFFGLGSKLAKVRVEKKAAEPKKSENIETTKKQSKEDKDTQKHDKQERQEKAEKQEKFNEKRPDREDKKDSREAQKRRKHEKTDTEKPANLVATTDHPALLFVAELAKKMDLAVEVTAQKNDDSIYIDIEGEDSGTIIGKRGQTLDSIQYLASLVANKGKDNYLRVVVDAENYRNKREKTLEQLAERLAGKVIKSKKTVRLEPMNPYERKVIHAKLQNNGKVTTRSEGEEPFRRVVIELK